ncbi:MAG: FMN-dependent NADH-azoreductase [Cycloclasticus pugetii]|jgi:FMN-dependent NADH-azoreductase|uniref:FMN dependent NADH:quinone oxidoreductase n=2 Tax=Cycloclasticus TaxID=34067 RepID=S5TU93_9GAMM|nr:MULTISPECIES: NAD(P)H-dependent oxidoreductase [Cycloclasticus]AFT68212.1 NAD(P)H dehydrogenase [Cycloclasticus sp. P1]AGS38585.1 Acyl carrier protein phosphodiesterase [Cycloclasticus zancles 78-ME]ATI02257.1 FMN-dependent NADH-azoreductase [Cycloclasticus sp. PY97N]EPD12521.1 NAD(P)H dehydrogenase [Cycloclasticus pugetii]PHR50616.1 MAG: FMN-dependent NADH-azoreductase [Cycloclasticus sp.]
MSKLLYIQASPRGERSSSTDVANTYIRAFKSVSADNTVTTLNIWDMNLPEFDGDRLNAKYSVLHGQNPNEAEALAWQQIVTLIEQFKNADCYLLSVPMWNFSIPYKLKHYIDIITQPGLTFSVNPETGFFGLVTGKPVTAIYSRGGEYSTPEAKGMDFQKTYLEMALGFIGFREINSVLIEPTLADPNSVNNAIAIAKEKATTLGENT